MVFSSYVREAIALIDYLEKDRDYNAVALIKGAAEKAGNDMDAHILNVIGGSMTMAYNKKNQVFTSLFEFEEGRSFGPEDLNETDIDILRSLIQQTKSSWLRTKFSHIVWTITTEKNYGQIAVLGYLESYQKFFDVVHWVSCYDQIKCAYQISSKIGKNSDLFKKVRSTIIQDLVKMNGEDPSFLSIRLLMLVIDDFRKSDFFDYIEIAEKLFSKNVDFKNDNTILSDESFHIIEIFYKHIKKIDEIKVKKEKYASYYAFQSQKQADKKDYFRAVHLMKKACILFSEVNREKAIALRLQMETFQKLMLKDIKPFTMKIDVKDTAKAVDKMFEGLTLTEAIVQFGRLSKIYNEAEVKQKLLEESDEHFMSSMFTSNLLNAQGQSVQELPPINDITDDSELFKKHMIHYVAEQRRMFDSIPIKMAFHHLRRFGTVSEEALDFLIKDNAIIPDNRGEIIKEGLVLALNGKLYTAMHILQPQTENIFRYIVKLCGDTVTFLKKDDGTEAYRPLSSLFKSEKLLECYDKNIIFTFQSIMDDLSGENLRNLIGHGVLEPDEGNSVASLCFLSLLIMLLSLYSAEAYSIRVRLSEV